MTQDKLIADGQSLESANYKDSQISIPVYDDGFGPLWIHRCSLGISGIVRAQTWHDAYAICEDEFFPEAEEWIADFEREYGADWIQDACFQEAFGFRPNGPNETDTQKHGIYSKDLNGDWLDRLTLELAERLRIEITISDDD